jgi:hypothetical protein
MAFPTAVNSQITDSVTQNSVNVVGSAPAMALASLLQSTAQAMANAAHNATTHQQNQWIIGQAATAAGVTHIYASAGVVVADAESPPPAPAAS